jgi:GH35 family endo-1,4-beta-xylanase
MFVVDPASLRARASPSLPIIGAAVNVDALKADPAYAATLGRQYNSVTPENVMKWGLIHPQPTMWNFADADALVDFAQRSAQSVHGHTLIWHLELPSYINGSMSPADAEAAMNTHIDTLVGRYRGRVASWDVVNEAVDDNGQLRASPWLSTRGMGYIAEAFRRARMADPNAILVYNDYGLETPGPKADGVANLLMSLKSANVPVDAVGLQFHVKAYDFASYRITENQLRTTIRRFGGMNLKVYISELDVDVSDLDASQAQRLAYQSQVYQRIAAICFEEPACEAVRSWGFTDKYSWLNTPTMQKYPLPFDESMMAKPAFAGLRDGLAGMPGPGFDFGLETDCDTSLNSASVCAPYESLGLSNWWTTIRGTGSVETTSTRAFRGKRSLQVNFTQNGQAAAGFTSPTDLRTGTLYLRAMVFVPTSVNVNWMNIFGLSERGAPYKGIAVTLRANGVAQVSSSVVTRENASGPNVFPKGQWNCVQLTVNIGSSGSAQLRINGTQVASLSQAATLPAGGHSLLFAGVTYADPAQTSATVFYDEVALGTTPLACP